jgi:16S rRNA (adenine1518-N6/adenine1519-N6)-dimethyltransferase
MTPKLGQHFLKDESALALIASSLNIGTGEVVAEIGPGHGELTEFILRERKDKSVRVILFERDPELAEELKSKYRSEANIEIRTGDAVKLLPALLKKERARLKIAGNIPYYITGKLLRILSEAQNPPETAVFTIQREVAERIMARPPRMNLLAAVTRKWASPEVLKNLSTESFSPPPKVESAIIAIRAGAKSSKTQKEAYFLAARALFAQPRKTILNNLRHKLRGAREETAEKLAGLGLNSEMRPGNLEVADIEAIAEIFPFK